MTLYLQDPDVTIWNADVLDALRELPDESVHMCCTSPPFYGLRDYGTGAWEGGKPDCDHRSPTMREGRNEDRAKLSGSAATNAAQLLLAQRLPCGKCGAVKVDQQIGLEDTPQDWVDRLVEVFREVRRVLRRDGSLWVEIGDSYGANQGKGFDTHQNGDVTGARAARVSPALRHPFKPKDLIGAPWLLAFALRADGWFLRSEIIWSKPNPMPESVSDRPTTSHSRVFLLTKSPRYYFDAEAIREPHQPDTAARYESGFIDRYAQVADAQGYRGRYGGENGPVFNPAGRNRRSVWTIPTQPYPEAHFATWPVKLVEPMILAGTSERGVCPECGAPWERVVETGALAAAPNARLDARTFDPALAKRGERQSRGANFLRDSVVPNHFRPAKTVGWQPTCGHDLEPVPATVLDPFGGSGTTALVARKHGRKAILIDLNPDYCALAARRLSQLSLFAGAGDETFQLPAAPASESGKNERSGDRRKEGFNERWKNQT